MNRSQFLAISSAAVAAGPVRAFAGAQAQQPAPQPRFASIRRNVGYFTARGGTIGWLSNRESLVTVDTHYPTRQSSTRHGERTLATSVWQPSTTVPAIQAATRSSSSKGAGGPHGRSVLHELHPRVDRPAGASIRNWMKTIDTVAKEMPADTVFIAGHTRPGLAVTTGTKELVRLRDYFELTTKCLLSNS